MQLSQKEDLPGKRDIKILVVDDREDNLFSIETILEHEGYTIVKANSGRAALKMLLQQQDFTLILMDVQMPDMNGFETANMIYERERLRNIPIIFITAHNYESEYIFKGYQLGGVDYISKPINPDLLRVKVSVFTELYQKTHQLLAQEKKLMSINKNLEKEVEERRLNEEKIHLLNQQLVENNTNLRLANEELNRFAYVASHDLQEPLRKIKLFSNTLAIKFRERIDQDMEVYLQKIVNASDRMQTLIRDLLEFSRQIGKEEEFTTIDLNKILAEVLLDMESEIEAKKAIISVGDLPVASVISSQIYQLFQNLISNALKYSKHDAVPQIQIYAESATKNGSGKLHRIYVKDNGIGFDASYAEEIFVVFKRLHSYHEVEGTGVGLAICKKIVEYHKGTIRAESIIGHGSTFIIDLPDVTVSLPANPVNTIPIHLPKEN
ncbi:response regulator [Cytophagaceae bacterium DM2B3-1]|uniref:histidine kinase n=1 Tax=Xanthocytophaga flava TaxID=3048013 RepID=A0ABT7CT83_9BACT|nr:response regulator [Xanthocytophaga flavus]MDJ1472159.1 response regulator [Xanthocytophaga flavus]MDJ1496943.1 response regulator [Xanthocytophaga flavus]